MDYRVVTNTITKSSHQMCSLRKVFLRNLTKFTEKHLCQSLFFNIAAGPRPATLLKMRLWHKCFPENFVKFLRTPISIEHVRWLLLYHNNLPISKYQINDEIVITQYEIFNQHVWLKMFYSQFYLFPPIAKRGLYQLFEICKYTNGVDDAGYAPCPPRLKLALPW